LFKLFGNKASTFIVLTILILAIGFPEQALTAKATTSSDDWTAKPQFLAHPLAAQGPDPLTPAQIITAYDLTSMTNGTGTTIAIIDAYNDPTIASDLSTFSTNFNLPAANFIEHKMSTHIQTDDNWSIEISLDVEWAHAIAPDATILLVEATSDSSSNLLAAVSYATSFSQEGVPPVKAVSISWGGSEFSTEGADDSYFTSTTVNPGIVFFAAIGDSGKGVIWPSVSPNVVSVGGTTLNVTSTGALISETAWSDSGGGVSAFESQPAYQANCGLSYAKRACPDVSFDADPSTGVSVYDSTPDDGKSGWWGVGGTSVGAPSWAAIQALGLSAGDSNFYQDGSPSSYFRDITSGSNGYQAGPGYDGVTGLGSPVTTNFAPPNGCLVVRGDDNHIYYRIYNSTTASWNGWNGLPTGATIDSPAAALVSNTLYVVVRGTDDSSLWFSSLNLTDDSFSGWALLGGSTPSAPTLASNGTALSLVVQGSDNRIYYRIYTIATQTWTGWLALPSGTTIDSPAASLVGNTLYIVVRGSDGATLWFSNINQTTDVFSGWTQLSGSTPSTPTLATFGTTLALVVHGSDSRVYYSSYSIATQVWTGWSALPSGTTPDSPAATIIGNTLFVTVIGFDGNIWTSSINLGTSTFSGWAQLSGSTPSKPTLAG